MREIKFRIFSEWHKKMYGGQIEGIQWRASFDKDGTINVEHGCHIMQYTGLKDKNGKEIYEGDILLWKCSKSGSDRVKIYKVVIDWGGDLAHSYSLTIHDKSEKWATGRSFWNALDREVIGNIYENQELL